MLDDIFKEIDSINWHKYTHAYGQATDVPQLLKDLASEDEVIRGKAQRALYGNIYHQGGVYDAAVPAIPILIKLALEKSISDRHEIIYHLLHLAVSDPKDYIRDLYSCCHVEYYYPKDTYWRVSFSDTELSELLNDTNELVRYYMVYALGFIQKNARSAALLIRDIIKKETDLVFVANALICLGILDYYNKDSSDNPMFEQFIEESHPFIVREAATFARITADRGSVSFDVIQFLLEIFRIEGTREVKKDVIRDIIQVEPYKSVKEKRKYVNSKMNTEFLWFKEMTEFVNCVFFTLKKDLIDIKNLELDFDLLLDILIIVENTRDVDDIHKFVIEHVVEIFFPYGDKSYLEGELTEPQQILIALFILSRLLWYKPEFKERGLPIEKENLLVFLKKYGTVDIFKQLIMNSTNRNPSFSNYFINAKRRISKFPEIVNLIEFILESPKRKTKKPDDEVKEKLKIKLNLTPLLTAERILTCLSKSEWQTFESLISKLKIIDRIDTKMLKSILKRGGIGYLARITVKKIEGKKYWKLK